MSAMDTDMPNGVENDGPSSSLHQWGTERVAIDFDEIAKQLRVEEIHSAGEVLLDALARDESEPPSPSPGEQPEQEVVPSRNRWHNFKLNAVPGYRERYMQEMFEQSIARRIHLMQVIGRPVDFHIGVGPRIKIAVVNTKGGVYKTTMVVNLASVLSEYTRRRTLVLDLNNNQGDAMRRLGIDPMRTLQLRAAYDDGKTLFKDYGAAVDLLPITHHGVSIISRDYVPTAQLAAEPGSLKKLTGKGQMEELIDMAFANCGFLLIDNSNMLEHPSNMAAVSKADILIFVGDANEGSSLEQLHEALVYISTMDKALAYKVSRQSIVALTGVRPAGLRQFAREIGFPGPCVAIPYDEVIRRGAPVDLGSIARETFSSFVDIANHVLMLAQPNLSMPIPQNDEATAEDPPAQASNAKFAGSLADSLGMSGHRPQHSRNQPTPTQEV